MTAPYVYIQDDHETAKLARTETTQCPYCTKRPYQGACRQYVASLTFGYCKNFVGVEAK